MAPSWVFVAALLAPWSCSASASNLRSDVKRHGARAPVLSADGPAAEEAATLKVYFYDLPSDVAMRADRPQAGFEHSFGELMQRSAQRVFDPREADFFYIPAEPIRFFLERREDARNCSQCLAADSRVVEELRNVGPFWDAQRAQHIVPSAECPTRPLTDGLSSFFPELWGGGAMQLCLHAAGANLDTYRSLHVSDYMSESEFTSEPASKARDLLAVYVGASASAGFRSRLVDGLRGCTDCGVLEVPKGVQPPAGFSQDRLGLLRRARFQIVPPGTALEAGAAEAAQGIAAGAVPVVFTLPAGSAQQLPPYQPLLDWSAFSVNFTLLPQEANGEHDFWPRLQVRLRELERSGQADVLAAAAAEVRDSFRWRKEGVVQTVLDLLAWRKMSPEEAGLAPWPAASAEGIEPSSPYEGHTWTVAGGLAFLLVLAVAPILPREGPKAFAVAVLYLSCLVLVRPLVKHTMVNGHPYPYTITIGHMLLTAAVASLIDRPQLGEAIQVLPVALVTGASLALGNTALFFGTAAFITMVGSYTPAATLLLLSLTQWSKSTETGPIWKRISGRTVGAVLLVCCGAAMCIKGEMAFSSMALVLGTMANFCRSCKTVWQHDLLQNSLSPYRTVAWTGIWSAILMVPVMMWYEGFDFFRTIDQAPTLGNVSLIASGLGAASLNIAQCLAVKLLGPLQQALIGNLQIIMVIVIAIVFLGEAVSASQWIGIFLVIAGCTLSKNTSKKKEDAPAGGLLDSAGGTRSDAEQPGPEAAK